VTWRRGIDDLTAPGPARWNQRIHSHAPGIPPELGCPRCVKTKRRCGGPQISLHTSPSRQYRAWHQAFIKTAQENTFTTSPVLPDCYSYAVEHGDPKTGPSVYPLLQARSWIQGAVARSFGESTGIVYQGHFPIHNEGRSRRRFYVKGAYAYVPAKHQHEESCIPSRALSRKASP
jgi:hypothetical protein